jgi:hypothetical protein
MSAHARLKGKRRSSKLEEKDAKAKGASGEERSDDSVATPKKSPSMGVSRVNLPALSLAHLSGDASRPVAAEQLASVAQQRELFVDIVESTRSIFKHCKDIHALIVERFPDACESADAQRRSMPSAAQGCASGSSGSSGGGSDKQRRAESAKRTASENGSGAEEQPRHATQPQQEDREAPAAHEELEEEVGPNTYVFTPQSKKAVTVLCKQALTGVGTLVEKVRVYSRWQNAAKVVSGVAAGMHATTGVNEQPHGKESEEAQTREDEVDEDEDEVSVQVGSAGVGMVLVTQRLGESVADMVGVAVALRRRRTHTLSLSEVREGLQRTPAIWCRLVADAQQLLLQVKHRQLQLRQQTVGDLSSLQNSRCLWFVNRL